MPTNTSPEAQTTYCDLCPRTCHVDRAHGQRGICGQTTELVAARAGLHLWEEPCLSGTQGSGTVFFSGCNLRCIFCQNYEIAQGKEGRPITVQRLSEIFLELQEKGAHNINLVTPSHYVLQIIPALETAKKHGLTLPIIYNTGSYEEVSTLRLLDGLIDIYLPDLKYFSGELSAKYSNAPDYFDKASLAIAEMFRQVQTPLLDENGMMRRGMIVRHLLLPGQVKDSKKVLRYLYETYHSDIYISILNQYTPLPHVSHLPELNRRVTEEEYRRVLLFAERLGICNGFYQEGPTADESFIPAFDGAGL